METWDRFRTDLAYAGRERSGNDCLYGIRSLSFLIIYAHYIHA